MKTTYNPLNIPNLSKMDIINNSYLLTTWAEQGEQDDLNFYETFNHYYQFGLHEMTGGVIDQTTGIYQYPEDTPLKPIVELRNQFGEACYIYDYGIVGIVKADGTTFVCRMD